MTFVRDVREIHVEPTTVCQASCPMCPRTILGYHEGRSDNHELSLDRFKSLIDPFLPRLDKIMFCGTLGEPAAAMELLEMIEHSLSVNPDITIGINTNGGLRTTAWWRRLADLTASVIRSYVVFSIDGMEDTNHIYRKNVSWTKLMENAAAYIKAGGNAQWDSLIFKHNQHQIDGMRSLAKDMGFRIFRTKVSSRPSLDRNISSPDGYDVEIKPTAFSCMAEDTASLYLAASGMWYPCCFIHHDDGLGGKRDWGSALTDADARTIAWNSLEHKIRTNDPPMICDRSCGTTHNKGQWIHEESF